MNPVDIYQQLFQLAADNHSTALVTVVDVKGSAPGKPGFKMLVGQEGIIAGTIGGGKLEMQVIEEARELLQGGGIQLKNYKLSNQTAGGLGMVCGGEMTVLIEPFTSPDTLLLIGGGHISRPMAVLAKMLGFTLIVTDDREEFCNPERFPEADDCRAGDLEQVLESLTITPSTYVVIVTRGHMYDQKALELTLKSEARYLGMIGSRNKVRTVFNNLKAKGFSDAELNRVHAPIGLKIGAKTVEEIAVSIMAEIIAVRREVDLDGLQLRQ